MYYLIILLLIITSPLFFSDSHSLNGLELNNLDIQRFDGIKEDFENDFFPPPGWEIKTNTEDTGGLTGTNLEDPITSSWVSTITPIYLHSGFKAAYISYLEFNYNWLITDLMGVKSDAKLKFWMFYGSELFPVKFFVLLKGNVTNEWDKIASYENAPINHFDYEVEIDLSFYAGQNVKIAFVQKYTDGWHIAVDDISFARFQYDLLSISEDNMNSSSIKLYQNYPNPFNPTTKIDFFNNLSGNVKLSVYNVKGELVNTLLNENLIKGFQTVNFDASGLNSGVYYYKLETPEKTLTKKMILVK